MRYIGFYNTSGSVQTAIDEQELGKPYVVYLRDEHRLDWNSISATPPLSAQPLTFEIISADTISFVRNKDLYSGPELTIEYNLNKGGWSEITNSFEGTIIPVSPGDIVQFRGNNPKYITGSLIDKQNTQLKVNGLYKIYGNIASLMSSTNFTSINDFPDYCFWQFFAGETGLTEVTELAFGNNIGSASWHAYCFQGLFRNCTNLTLLKTLAQGSFGRAQFRNWLDGAYATGTLVKNPISSFETYIMPNGWTVQDA